MIRYNRTYRLFALTMALLMFFVSAGIAVDMHYCGGELKSVSFFGKAKTCHDMVKKQPATMPNCPHHKKTSTKKPGCTEDKNCCSNKTLLLQSEGEQQLLSSDFVFSKRTKHFVAAFVQVFLANNYNKVNTSVSYTHHKPPLISRDISVLFQTFLL